MNILRFSLKKKVCLLVTVLFLLGSLSMVTFGAEENSKFKEIPLEWILELQEKLAANVMTPGGPNNEKVLSADALSLTPEEIEAAKQLTFGEYFFMGASLDETEVLNKYGMDKILSELGKEPIAFMGSASIAEQMDQIDALAGKASAVNFVVAQAWEAVTLGPSFVALSKAGVPQVHNWTTPAGLYGEENYIGLVDADGYGQGAAAAEILAYAMDYKGEVGLIYFVLEQWTNVMRLKGAKDTFAKYPEIKIIAEAGFTDPSESYDLALGMLQANQDIDAVWGTWMMGPATGAAEAVIALKKAGEIVVAAPDLGGITGARYIADPNHPIIGCGEADCIEMGENSIRAAVKWMLGKKDEVRNGYFVSNVYPIVRANLVDGFNAATRGASGELPQDVLDLLK
ncbi:MAG: D-allose transporter subunit [Firmicutes bacterium ADurb.Bin419]|jgi:ribose transport system substrate-binding protein|nr:MAG: D-allose transporter subunit [Firmicutes bacterium ADurb.Bin419]